MNTLKTSIRAKSLADMPKLATSSANRNQLPDRELRRKRDKFVMSGLDSVSLLQMHVARISELRPVQLSYYLA